MKDKTRKKVQIVLAIILALAMIIWTVAPFLQ